MAYRVLALLVLLVLTGLAGCLSGGPLRDAEQAYELTRYYADQLDVTRARGTDTSIHGVTEDRLLASYRAARDQLVEALARVDTARLDGEDRRAWGLMVRTVEQTLGPNPAPAVDAPAPLADCGFEPRDLLERGGAELLSGTILTCYGAAASRIILAPDTLDRLTIFGLLGTTSDSVRRRQLFLALQPVWRSVNGDGGEDSPWRILLAARTREWEQTGLPHVRRAEALGIAPDSVEPMLIRMLTAWRATLPDSLVEPWDWYYHNGELDRVMESRVPRDRLRAINDSFYASLGAQPVALGIRYDIEPREGKYPVAYTTFGARPHRREGAWSPGEPWIFASYRVGGLGNLGELLHETGHAVHIAAIRTRPAFTDWPDSDTFTEAIADLAGHDLFEPEWQARWLGGGATVPLGVSLRAKYGSVMLDAAWALFELRMFREPDRSPNEVWAEIGESFLGIRPHPEWSWWAMRGQLIESPGYMLNYALGAALVAAVRERLRQERPVAPGEPDPGWYGWASSRLYQPGRSVPTTEVLRDVLGGPLDAEALLRDLARGRASGP